MGNVSGYAIDILIDRNGIYAVEKLRKVSFEFVSWFLFLIKPAIIIAILCPKDNFWMNNMALQIRLNWVRTPL